MTYPMERPRWDGITKIGGGPRPPTIARYIRHTRHRTGSGMMHRGTMICTMVKDSFERQ